MICEDGRRFISRTGEIYAIKLNSRTHHLPLRAAIEFYRTALAHSRDEAPPVRFSAFFSVLNGFVSTRNGSRREKRYHAAQEEPYLGEVKE